MSLPFMDYSATTPSSSRQYRLLGRLIVGLLIGGAALWWTMRDLEGRAVWQTLAAVSPFWVSVSVGGVGGVALAKTARWGALYPAGGRRLSFNDLFSVLMIAQMINLVIPVRMGELIRIGLMRQLGRPGGVTLSTIVVEKALDLVAAGLIAVSLAALAVAPTWLQERAVGILLIGLVMIVGLVLIWWLRDKLEQVVAHVLGFGNILPIRWQERLLKILGTMLNAFGTLTDRRSLTRILFWTTVVWLLSLLSVVMLFVAFEFRLPLAAAVIMVLAISSSNIFPSPPALVGIMHLIAVVVLGQYGVTRPVAVGFGIILNIVMVAPLIVLGGWAMGSRTVMLLDWWRNYSLNQLQVK